MSVDCAAEPMWPSFEASVAIDTSPGEGNHRVSSDDPRLQAFIDSVARPELARLGASMTTDTKGNLVAAFGARTGDELLFVVYPVSHHANRMSEPLRARRISVDGRAYWCGQGASEGKGPFVALLHGLEQARAEGAELGGRVMVAVSTEGSSTNESSSVMFRELEGPPPRAVVLAIGTENKIALGHRGRADVIVVTTGPVRHSSVAAGLPNPIEAIAAGQQRVAEFAGDWAGGGRSVTPYRLVCGPVAPHTMPERCELALDCRFLPGDDPDALLRLVKAAIDDPAVEVKLGPVMLPAHIDVDSPLVSAFVAAGSRAGLALQTFMPAWTFDAGAASSRGIPAILFGPSANNLESIEDTDAVAVDTLVQAADVYAQVVRRWTRP